MQRLEVSGAVKGLMRHCSATGSRSRSWFTDCLSNCTARDSPVDLSGGGIASFTIVTPVDFGTVPYQSARRNYGRR